MLRSAEGGFSDYFADILSV